MDAKLCIEIAIVAILVIAFIIWLAWQIKKKGLKDFATKTIVEAEKEFNKGENAEKLNYVIDKVIAFIPVPLNFFITRELVKDFIQKIFNQVKVALDYVPEESEE